MQVLVRWAGASGEYERAVRLGAKERAQANLILTEELLARAKSEGEAKAKVALFEALNTQGRQYEAMEFGKGLGDFWNDRKKDLSVLPELVKRLEAKLLPVPGTEVLMSKTEFTVGEWKLYLKAEGLPDWQHPVEGRTQPEEHPVVNVSWNQAMRLCEWLSRVTGKAWRLPTNKEWEAAVGTFTYPWGDYYPPNWDDGNYSISADGKDDRTKTGVDGIRGTAPVASFKPNALGFYDLGGNVGEWMLDGFDPTDPNPKHVFRGGGWFNFTDLTRSANRFLNPPTSGTNSGGFRLARGPMESGERQGGGEGKGSR